MIYISAVGMLSALGNDLTSTAASLTSGTAPGMQIARGWLIGDREGPVGKVLGDLPAVPAALKRHNSRNNQLLLAALAQIAPEVDAAIQRYGQDRIAIILGTSTSGLDEGDRFVSGAAQDYYYEKQELGDPSRFLAAYLRTSGPAWTISTACSSSARAVISGQRLIEAGLVDVALVGGADTLSRMPVNGFDSLESLAPSLCQPFSAERNGITIGEGAALMLLTREPQPVALLGVGESSDAYHMSAPHPQGEGAIRAVNMALAQAQLQPEDVGYINLHGTATPLNDQVESRVVAQVFGSAVPCSSTKHLTGHTLGAAGICEAALSWLLLTQPLALPPQIFTGTTPDTSLPAFGLLLQPQPLQKPVVMTNSFAFGGNNVSLLLGRLDG